MPDITIPDVYAVLQQRATAARQSLPDYLRTWLIEEASRSSRPSTDEVLTRAGGRSGGSVPLEDAVRDLRADRDRH